jgi:hypothetical protein
MVVFVFLIASLSPGFAQTQIDAATRQDVEDLMRLTGAREPIPLIYSAMAGQFAPGFAARYQPQHPNAGGGSKGSHPGDRATPTAVERIPGDELLAAMIPVSQRYFTHSDSKAIKDSMAHPPDQKLLKNTNAMMIDTMQAAQAVRNKPMPEIEAQIEKTAAGASQPALTQPK